MFYSPASRDRPGAQGFVTASPGTALHPSISFSGDRITGIFQPQGAGSHTWGVATTGVERLRIDSGGLVTLNTAGTGNLTGDHIELHGDASGHGNANISVVGWSTNAHLKLYRSGGSTIGTHAAANGGGAEIDFFIDDGVQFQQTAFIYSGHDGTVSAGVAPGLLRFATAAQGAAGNVNEAMRIDSNGNVNIGNQGSLIADVFGVNPRLQVANAGGSAINISQYTNNTNAPYLSFTKSRGTSIGSNVAVQSGDNLGYITGDGYDATGTPVLREAAFIGLFADAAPTAGTVPGRITLATTPAGGTFGVERLRIDSTGQTTIQPSSGLYQLLISSTNSTPWNFAITQYSNDNQPAYIFTQKSRSGVVGTLSQVTSGDQLFGIFVYGADGAGSIAESGQCIVSTVATPWLISATAAWTTSTNTITMTSNPGFIVPGMFVYDVTKNAKVGTVSTYNGTSLVLTANALVASSGTTDQLYFTFAGLVPARYDYYGQIYGQGFNFTAAAAWTTSSTTITVTGGVDNWATLNGAYVYDRTNGQYIGRVSSVNNTGPVVITLQAAALHASSGASDSIKITTYQTGLFNPFRIDESGAVTIGVAGQTNLLDGGPGVFTIGDPQSGSNYFYVANYNTGSGGKNRNIYLQLYNYNNDGYGEGIYFSFSRGTNASASAVQNGDAVSWVAFQAYNGSNTSTCAQIQCNIDATYTSGTGAPGSLLFETCPAGGSNTLRWTLSSSGDFINDSTGILYLNNNLLSLRGAGDTNHGMIYNSSVDGPQIRGYTALTFATGSLGGVERMRIVGQTGNVQWTYFNINSNIGGQLPGNGLVPGASMAIGWNATNGNRDQAFFNCDTTPAPESFTYYQMTSTSAATKILSVGQFGLNIGSGTPSPASGNNVLCVQNGNLSGGIGGTGNLAGCYIYMTTGAVTYIDSMTSGTAGSSFQFRTYNNGTYEGCMAFTAGGQPQFPNAGSTTNAANMYFDGSRYVYQVVSSMRFKTDATPVPQSRLDAAFAIDPIEYNSLCDGDNKDHRYVGLSAEEVAEIDPALAYYDKDGLPLGVHYNHILLLQVAALKQKYELDVGSLKQEIAELKARLH